MAFLFVLSEHYRSADKSDVREYSGGRAASVSLRIFFWLRQKLRCVASRPSVDGKMLAIEPRVRCGAHIPKRNAIHLDGISFCVIRTLWINYQIRKQNHNPATAVVILKGGATEQARDDFFDAKHKKAVAN